MCFIQTTGNIWELSKHEHSCKSSQQILKREKLGNEIETIKSIATGKMGNMGKMLKTVESWNLW